MDSSSVVFPKYLSYGYQLSVVLAKNIEAHTLMKNWILLIILKKEMILKANKDVGIIWKL